MRVLEELKAVATTLNELVKYLTEERRNKDDAIRNILLINHPAFKRFAEATQTPYRVFFTNKEELATWLSSRSWVQHSEWDRDEDDYDEWFNNKLNQNRNVQLSYFEEIFDDKGNLKIFTDLDWSDDWVRVKTLTPAPAPVSAPTGRRRPTPPKPEEEDEDIPF